MKRESFRFDSKEAWLEARKKDITSTNVSALFNLNPRISYYHLYHLYKGTAFDDFEENDFTKWGKRLEKTIAEGIAEDNDFKIKPFEEYIRLPEKKVGSSFDFKIIKPLEAIFEIKNMDAFHFKNSWVIEEGEVIEAPYSIELQIQHQMLVSGIDKCYLGALIGGNKTALLFREANPKIHEKILEKVEEFWMRIEQSDEPEPDLSKDYDVINQIYSSVNEGKVLHRPDDKELEALVMQYKDYSDLISETDKMRRACKADIIQRVGDFESAIGSNYKISRKLITKKPYTVEPKPYRDFRISVNKGEEK